MAGGCSGSAGGVGEAVGPVSEIGVTGGVVDGRVGLGVARARGERERDAHETAIAPESVVENLC